jgi:hypothetical protein
MSFISNSVRSIVQPAVRLLNQPPVKQGVKDLVGVLTVIFGLAVTYDTFRRFHQTATNEASNAPINAMKVADKVMINCAKLSLILSAATSRLGVIALSRLVHTVASSAQLERLFGPNTIFAVNPWHPRHVFSIGAVLLAFPFLARSIYQRATSCCSPEARSQTAEPVETGTLTRWKINTNTLLIMLFITTVTSRPVLHLGNQLGQLLIK